MVANYALSHRALAPSDHRPGAASVRGVPTTPSGRSTTRRRGRSVHRAGIVPELPSISRQTSAVSPSSVRHPSTSSSTSRRPPGAATNRTRLGRNSTT